MLFWSRHHKRRLTFEEVVMASFDKLNADLVALSAKVDALLAKQPPAPDPAPDEQPQVDAADAAVEAISAKIPA